MKGAALMRNQKRRVPVREQKDEAREFVKKLLGRNRAARQQLRTMHLRRKAGEKAAEKLRWKQPQLLRSMARWRRDTRLQR